MSKLGSDNSGLEKLLLKAVSSESFLSTEQNSLFFGTQLSLSRLGNWTGGRPGYEPAPTVHKLQILVSLRYGIAKNDWLDLRILFKIDLDSLLFDLELFSSKIMN